MLNRTRDSGSPSVDERDTPLVFVLLQCVMTETIRYTGIKGETTCSPREGGKSFETRVGKRLAGQTFFD